MNDIDAIIDDLVELSLAYGQTSARHAEVDVILQSLPMRPGLVRLRADARLARDVAHARLLRRLHDLEDAGEPVLARLIRVNAHANASMAETLAISRVLAGQSRRGVA